MQALVTTISRKESVLFELSSAENAPVKKKKSSGTHPLLQKEFSHDKRLPEISETQLVRHFYRLARLNYSWEDGLYPLGSCTMKYNPLLNDKLASDADISALHPSHPEEYVQGAMQLIHELESDLCTILDLPGITLQPAAGAHGELAGVFMMRAYFAEHSENRNTILIPDSAHGTNPASAAMAGFTVEKVPTNEQGTLNLDILRKKITNDTAALMLTNPNTLGLFEKDIIEIKSILNEYGALLYIDGANLNALMGKVSFGKMGVDLTQLNLHKTFSTPHGGGGPGQGALLCSERMLPYLPSPQITKDERGLYRFVKPDKTIGKMKQTYGQFSVMVRAWAYIKSKGKDLSRVTEKAVYNSNYLKERLSRKLNLSSSLPTLHETVFDQSTLKKYGATTKNLAKALLDRGFYAPTVYFPLNVDGAIMVEPTETESLDELDAFTSAIFDIFELLETEPEKILQAPFKTPVRNIDETQAARQPVLTWQKVQV